MHNGSLRGPREESIPNTILEETIDRNALHEAASVGDEKTLLALLAGGADRNSKDPKHANTPLHEAAWRGFSRCVKALCTLPQIKSPKDIKETKIKGVLQDTRGALHSALLGTRNGGGFSALHLAAQNGHNQSCREILLAGADPNVQNNYGDTPIHTACRYGHAGATRILLSAKCDPNRTNLNGDTPLHIACAMGRRKLTRILLEAGSNFQNKNAQDETPRDIALRKNLVEILEILDNPIKIKSTKERERSSSNSKNADKIDGGTKSTPTGTKKKDSKNQTPVNPANWSPYGCHYFPDPRSFPSPKLETLPKEPLAKGEQYYLDLAGNIRKGPIGVGNTCYCGPFFRHIEERISRNRKSIRKYVHKATERLDNKVQALALRTDDQIEQLTRSMIADRIRCEGRRIHLEQWLKRGDPNRTTIGHQTKSKKNLDNTNTLTRSRSLEILDEDDFGSKKIQNSRSFDLLDDTEVIVHRNPESNHMSASPILSSDRKTSRNSDKSRSSGIERDSYSVSERLEVLLAKTNEILEMERVARRRKKDLVVNKSPEKQSRKSKNSDKSKVFRHSMYGEDLIEQLKQTSLNDTKFSRNESEFIAQEMHKITSSLMPTTDIPDAGIKSEVPPLSPEISKDFTSQKELERKSDQEHERSSILSGSSHKNPSSAGSGYVPDFTHLRVSKNRPSSTKSTSDHNSSPMGYPDYSQDYQNIVEANEIDAKLKFKNLISALRKDYQTTKQAVEAEFSKESSIGNNLPKHLLQPSYEPQQQSQLPIDDEIDGPNGHAIMNGFYQNTCFEDVLSSSNNTLKSEKQNDLEDTIELSEMANVNEINELKSRILNGSNWRSQVLKKSQQQLIPEEIETEQSVNVTVQKFEIKNSEIKTLKSPTSGILRRSKVQELVAKLQGQEDTYDDQNEDDNSESSEDEHDPNSQNFQRLSNDSMYYFNRAQPQVAGQFQTNNLPTIVQNQTRSATIISSAVPIDNTRIIDTRNLIPKDAYFHELPNKNRMRPIVDKLPEKQMINFTDQFQNSNGMMARTRNPLPYVQDYDVPIPNNTYIEPSGLDQIKNHNKNFIKHIPHREKLLSNRKFTFSNAVDYELSRIHHQQQEISPVLQQTISITPEQAQLERDMNNDSGYSTKICGSSHGPSPSLSGHTDYGHNTGSNDIQQTGHLEANGVTYFIGNVGASSLV